MKKYAIASLAVVGFSGAVGSALAGDSMPTKPLMLVMEQAVALAGHHGRGTVIEVELARRGEREFYEAKVAGERGEVRELKIDARTAELIEDRRNPL